MARVLLRFGVVLCAGLTVMSVSAIGSLPAADGYVGSQLCSACHFDKGQGWVSTLHSSIYRDPTPANVISPFHGEVRLSKPSKNIPEVVITLDDNGGKGPYTATIGGQTFSVTRAHGGKAIAENEDPRQPDVAGHSRYIGKQRYQVTINGVHYILPIQWNPIPDLDGNNQGWVEYHLEDWFDTSGNLALNTAQNEERRCAGCHQTGVRVDYDATSGLWVYGAVEENIGCESCHGPGQAHVSAQTPEERRANIIVPDEIVDLDRQIDVCGQCHSRGHSVEVINGKTLGFPYANGRGFRPGDNLADLYVDAGGYWPGGVSKQHHQQAADYRKSEMSEHMACWACHDPHGTDNEHDLITTARDNSLCAQCHSDKVANIEEHSHHPASDPSSPRCVDCHMNAAQKSAVNFDIHQHTFEVMTPADSLALNQPSSCGICHRSYNGTTDTNIASWNEESDNVISGWLNTMFKQFFGGTPVTDWSLY